MLTKTMSFSAIVNDNYLHISHHLGQLHINKITINMPYDLCSLSVSKDRIYVVYSHIRHDGFYLIDNEIPLNNIVAYDFTGKCVWEIKNIWAASSMIKEQMRPGVHFCKVEWYNDEMYLKYFLELDDKHFNKGFEICENHEYLVCHTTVGEYYIIDLTINEIVHIAHE